MKKSALIIFILLLVGSNIHSQTLEETEALKSIHGKAFKRVEKSQVLDLSSQLAQSNITIPLFSDLTISAKKTLNIKQPKTGQLWHGDLTEGAKGYIELFVRNGIINGTVYTTTSVYKIDGKTSGAMRVIELTPNDLPDHDCSFDAHKHEGDHTITRKQNHKAKATPANPSVIDVMVLYPPSIETAMGGSEGMENEIYYRIAEANQVFSNSEIYVEFRLAHHQSISSIAADAQGAEEVRTTEVNDLRELYKADLVSFWSDNGSAGNGYNFEGTGSKTAGFNTSRFTLVQTYYTFIHECGHNLGAKHDRQAYYESSPTSSKLNVTPYYRYGKSFVGYRSVMSYNNCNDLPGGSSNDCERVPYFTNPDIIVNGEPFGVSGDFQTYEVDGPANNAQRINETAPYVEDWYESLNTNYYTLTVNNGTGSGSYAEEANILISALNAPQGKTFDQWIGDTENVADIYNPYTSIIIGDADITISPSYKTIDYSENVIISIPIISGNDDVEEYGDGSGTVYLTSSDLEMTLDGSKGNQAIGLKFNDIQIPTGMEIQSASIRFIAERTDSDAADLTISIEDNIYPSEFTDVDVTSRTTATLNQPWVPTTWVLDQPYSTPDLSAIIQQVIGQPNWNLGNDLVFIIEGTGVRSAYAFEGDEQKVAQLTIVFKETPNNAPTLNTVYDQLMAVNSTLEITSDMIDASDLDNDPLTIILGNGANYSVTGTTVIPNTDYTGDLLVPIKVSDSKAESESLNMTISVDALTSLSSSDAISLNSGGIIQLNTTTRATNINIVNTKGAIVSNTKIDSQKIDLNKLITNRGLYLIQIETTDGIVTFKAIKE